MLIKLRNDVIIRDTEILVVNKVNNTVFVYYESHEVNRPVESAMIHDELGYAWKFFNKLIKDPLQDTI